MGNGDSSGCLDACGVVDRDGSTCLDACGVPNGNEDTCLDDCGVANGDGSSCACDGLKGKKLRACTGNNLCHKLINKTCGDNCLEGKHAKLCLQCQAYDGDCKDIVPADAKTYKMRKCLKKKKKCIKWGYLA